MRISSFTLAGRRRAAAALSAAILFSITHLPAIEQTGSLKGVVRDENRQALAGVIVVLKGANLQGGRAASSSASGEFIFRLLPPGLYTVKYTSPGYEVIEQEGVTVNVGRVTSLVVEMIRGGATESVSVIGEAPLVDTQRTNTQDNYTSDYLENASVGSGGRDYLSVIANTAGTGSGDGGNITVRGATLGENAYLIDGVDSTDPVTATFGSNFIFDAIQEVQVQTGGYAAEFGRATGGIISIVTKSGGNDFSGSFDVRYRNQHLIEEGDHLDPDTFSQKRLPVEGTLGGPIVKDRLWFFTALSHIDSDFQPSGSETLRSFTGQYYLGKLTWALTPSQKIIFQVTGDPATIDNADASVLVAKEATSKLTQGSDFISAQYEAILTPSLTLHTQAAHYHAELDFEPQDGDFSTIGLVEFFTGFQFANSIDVQFSDRYRDQINATLAWSVPDLAGEHLFKFGADIHRMSFEFEQFVPGGEFDELAPDANGVDVPLVYTVTTSAGRLENDGQVSDYFAQDEWRVHPRVTVNAGVRYESYSYDDDRGRKILEGAIFQPRLGAAWDITGDARNVVKIYGGVFGHPSLLALPRQVNTQANASSIFLNEEIAGHLFGIGPVPIDIDGDNAIGTRVFFTSFGGPGGSEFAKDGRLDPTRVLESSLSYERQFNPKTAAGLTLVKRETRDIIEDEFIFSRGRYSIGNEEQLTRHHTGAELRFTTAFRNWQLWSSYSYGISRGNIEYTQGFGSDYDFAVHERNRFGYLSDDTRHTLRANGYWDLKKDIEIGFAAYYGTGLPQTRVINTLPYGVEFIRKRGYLRGPDFSQINLEFRKSYALGSGRLQILGAIENLLNRENPGTGNALDPELQAVGYQSPRRYEVGLRYAF